MADKKSFVLYNTDSAFFDLLEPDDCKSLIMGIFAYTNGDEPQMTHKAESAFKGIKWHLDESAEKYKRTVAKRKEAAEKRWANANGMQMDASALQKGANGMQMDAVNENENENENVKVNENGNGNVINVIGGTGGTDKPSPQRPSQSKRFSKPTIEQIADYCRERKNNIDAHRFFDYYEANGWKVGKNAMKDWKAAIRTWEKNDTKCGSEVAEVSNADKYKSLINKF